MSKFIYDLRILPIWLCNKTAFIILIRLSYLTRISSIISCKWIANSSSFTKIVFFHLLNDSGIAGQVRALDHTKQLYDYKLNL
jgi:hypothetical protein